jgi:hypothetical protein
VLPVVDILGVGRNAKAAKQSSFGKQQVATTQSPKFNCFFRKTQLGIEKTTDLKFRKLLNDKSPNAHHTKYGKRDVVFSLNAFSHESPLCDSFSLGLV